MAFDPYVRARALLSALGMFRQTRHILTPAQVAARIRARFDPFGQQNWFTIWNLVRSAETIIDRAEDLMDDPTRRFGARFLPRDPSILGHEERYLYRVIVHAQGMPGQLDTEMLVLVRSDRPLTGAEAMQQAFDTYNSTAPPIESPRAREARISFQALTAVIITAGQRGP